MPIVQKGSRMDPSNCCNWPVSLTSVCCKVMEHIIHNNIMTHLGSDGICQTHKWCSAELQLLQTIHNLAFNLDQKSLTDLILFDFDSVLTHRPATKTELIWQIRGNVIDWITSFLTGCTQNVVRSVVCGGCTSTPYNVLSGVPQGSVLGPLLFLIYINDITQELNSICCLYADDGILYRRINSFTDVRALQDDKVIWNMKEKVENVLQYW